TTLSVPFDYELFFVLPQDYTDFNELASDTDFIYLIETVLANHFLDTYENNITLPGGWSIVGLTGNFKIVSSTANNITIEAPVVRIDTGLFQINHNYVFLPQSEVK